MPLETSSMETSMVAGLNESLPVGVKNMTSFLKVTARAII